MEIKSGYQKEGRKREPSVLRQEDPVGAKGKKRVVFNFRIGFLHVKCTQPE